MCIIICCSLQSKKQMKSSWFLYFIQIFQTISVIMRKNSSFTDFGQIRRKSSNNLLANSHSSSKFSLNQFQTTSLRPAKGFSFGGSQRNSLMDINVVSPSAKYNIKGLVEINLNQRKGPSIGAGREDSIEKTPLSYIKNNSNPGPATYSSSENHFKSNASIKIGKRKNEILPGQFLNSKVISTNPGPGAYPVKVVKLKGGKMTTQSKRFDELGKENYHPGPGTYSTTNMDAVSKGGSRVSFKEK